MSRDHPVTEAERSEIVDRDTVRGVIQAQAVILIDMVLNTPPDKHVHLNPLLILFEDSVRRTVEDFRERNRRRFLAKLSSGANSLS